MSLGFKPTRYDRDVWLKPCPTGNGYDYICTHVDDFKIIADDPQAYLSGRDNLLRKEGEGERISCAKERGRKSEEMRKMGLPH